MPTEVVDGAKDEATEELLICTEPRENCRDRVSILGVASIIIWGWGIKVFFDALVKTPNILPKYKNQLIADGLPKEMADQVETFFMLIGVLFIVHWFRLYLSILIYDESITIFHRDLQKLSVFQRFLEYIFRLTAFILTLLLIHEVSTLNPKSDVVYKTIIEFGLWIYLTLFIWDILMWGVTKNLSGSRWTYLITDGCGLLAILMYSNLYNWGLNEILWIMFLLLVLLGIAMIFVVVDLIKSSTSYWRHIKSYLNYFGLMCVYDCSNPGSGSHRHHENDYLTIKNLFQKRTSRISCKKLGESSSEG